MSSGILHKELDRRKIYDRALGAFKREEKTSHIMQYFVFYLYIIVYSIFCVKM